MLLSISKLCVIIFAIFFIQRFSNAKRDFRVVLKNIVCKNHLAETISKYNCRLEERENRSYLQMEFALKQPAPEIVIHCSLTILRQRLPKITIYDKVFDACQYFSSTKKRQQYIKLVTQDTKTLFNKVPRCPLDVNFTYKMTDFYVDEEALPSYTPTFNFRVEATLYQKEAQKSWKYVYYLLEGETIDTSQKDPRYLRKG